MFKIGDEVKIINADHFIKGMRDMIGMRCTIQRIDEGFYILKEDPIKFLWAESELRLIDDIIIKEEDILNIMR
jgi:hypothetical protein